jgi:phosphoglycolate phosphatase
MRNEPIGHLLGCYWSRKKAVAMEQEGIALYVGDHPLDMAGAKAAGVHAVGVTTGSHTASQLYEAGAVAVYPSLTDLRLKLESVQNFSNTWFE